MTVDISGLQVPTMKLRMLHDKKRFTKNHHQCTAQRGLLQGHNCITFQKISHICLMVDHENEKVPFISDNCGLKYEEKVSDATQAVPEHAITLFAGRSWLLTWNHRVSKSARGLRPLSSHNLLQH